MKHLLGESSNGTTTKVPSVVGMRPLGTNVLVELLTPQECLNTKLSIGSNVSLDLHQAYVLDIGPRVPEEHGLEKGQRVYLSGSINFCPNYGEYRFDQNGRKRGTVEYSTLKGVCLEEATDIVSS